MRVYDAPSIRNVALVGHSGAGKTQLVSALLFDAGEHDHMHVVRGDRGWPHDPLVVVELLDGGGHDAAAGAYPQVAVYKGAGSTNDAASFSCKLP